MDLLDCKGKSCPLPVTETKSLLESKEIHEITVLVDNEVSSENVKRFLESRGFSVGVQSREGEYAITGAKTAQDTPSNQREEKRILVFIDGETIGRGSEELGGILMRSFLHTLKELDPKPWRMIFINSGVKLAAEGSPYLEILKDLAGLGVEILSCGTCLDYFHLKERLIAGRISNMYEIVSSFSEATNVIKP